MCWLLYYLAFIYFLPLSMLCSCSNFPTFCWGMLCPSERRSCSSVLLVLHYWNLWFSLYPIIFSLTLSRGIVLLINFISGFISVQNEAWVSKWQKIVLFLEYNNVVQRCIIQRKWEDFKGCFKGRKSQAWLKTELRWGGGASEVIPK